MTDTTPTNYADTRDVRTIGARYGVTEDDVRLAAHVLNIRAVERPRWVIEATPAQVRAVEDRIREIYFDPTGADMFIDVTTRSGRKFPFASRDEYGVITYYRQAGDDKMVRVNLYGVGIATARKARIEPVTGTERLDAAALTALPIGAVVTNVEWDEARGDEADETIEAEFGLHLGNGMYAVWNGWSWSGLRRDYARPHAASPARLVEVGAWKSE